MDVTRYIGEYTEVVFMISMKRFFSKIVTSKVLFHPKDPFAERVNSQGQTLIYNPFDMNPKRLYNRKVKRL